MTHSPETSAKGMTSDRMDAMKREFITLHERSRELADADPATAEKVAKRSSDGLSHLRQAMLHLQMGLDPAKVQEAMDAAADAYNECVALRGELIGKKLRGVTGPSITDSVEAMESKVAPDASKKDLRIVALGGLKKVAKNLDAEENNPFFRSYTKKGKRFIEVDFALVNKTRREIDDLRRAGMNDPVLGKIETAMRFIESTDPIRASYNRMNLVADQMKGTFDWKPLRIIGAIGGVVVTTLGLASSFVSGEALSWPTALWAGLLVTSARPDLLMSNKTRAMQTLQKMEVPTFKNLMDVGKFSGPDGAEAFAEIRALEKSGAFKDMKGLSEINNAQIALVAGEKSALAKILRAFSTDADRASALKQFIAKIREGNGQLVEDVIRIKPSIPL